MCLKIHSVPPRLSQSGVSAIALLATLVLPPALSGATVEERLAALEQQVTELRAENAALRKELGFTHVANAPKDAPVTVAPALVRPAGKETKFALGGFIQANAETGGVPDSRYAGMEERLLLRRARVNFAATFAEHFAARIEADFGANSIAGGSGARGQLTDGFIHWTRYPEATLKVGQFKTPFGFEQLASDTKLYTIERALSSDRLTVSRQIGATLGGDLAEKRFSYTLGLFNGNGVNTGNNDNDDFMFAGRLNGSLLSGKSGAHTFMWTGGVNAFTSEDTGTSFSGRRSGLGFDTQFVFGPAVLQAEWLQNKRDPLTGATSTSDGWSLLGAWSFDRNWRGVVRYDTFDSNTALGAMETDEWTFGVDYLIKGDDLKFSINYLLGDQPAAVGRDDRLLGRLQVVF